MLRIFQCYWPPFFVIALVAIAMILNGCASTSEPLPTATDDSNVIVVGTLADANDPYDMAAAPVITQATVVRKVAFRALQRHRIDAATAQKANDCADRAIDTVNAGYRAKSFGEITRAGELAKQCKAGLDKAKDAGSFKAHFIPGVLQ